MVRLKETWTLLTFFRINNCYYKRSFYSHTQWLFYHIILFYFTAGKFCVWSWRIPGLLDRNVGFVVCRNSRASVAHMLYSGKEIQAKNNKWWKSWGVYRIVENTDPYSVHPSACLIFGPKKKPTFRDPNPLVSLRNDVRGRSAEIPYWWRFTTQICVDLLIGPTAKEICFNQSEELPISGKWHGHLYE